MKWNNGREHKLFEKQQAELREKYIAAGMTEEQMQAMYDYDLAVLNGRQREARHTQDLDMSIFDEDGDEGKSPLLDKFVDRLTAEIDRNEVNRYAWIEEIEDKRIVGMLKKLSEQDKELLTKIIIDGYSLTEIGSMENITPQAISKRFQKIKKFFQNRL